jgi:hypothetical protein
MGWQSRFVSVCAELEFIEFDYTDYGKDARIAVIHLPHSNWRNSR